MGRSNKEQLSLEFDALARLASVGGRITLPTSDCWLAARWLRGSG